MANLKTFMSLSSSNTGMAERQFASSASSAIDSLLSDAVTAQARVEKEQAAMEMTAFTVAMNGAVNGYNAESRGDANTPPAPPDVTGERWDKHINDSKKSIFSHITDPKVLQAAEAKFAIFADNGRDNAIESGLIEHRKRADSLHLAAIEDAGRGADEPIIENDMASEFERINRYVIAREATERGKASGSPSFQNDTVNQARLDDVARSISEEYILALALQTGDTSYITEANPIMQSVMGDDYNDNAKFTQKDIDELKTSYEKAQDAGEAQVSKELKVAAIEGEDQYTVAIAKKQFTGQRDAIINDPRFNTFPDVRQEMLNELDAAVKSEKENSKRVPTTNERIDIQDKIAKLKDSNAPDKIAEARMVLRENSWMFSDSENTTLLNAINKRKTTAVSEGQGEFIAISENMESSRIAALKARTKEDKLKGESLKAFERNTATIGINRAIRNEKIREVGDRLEAGEIDQKKANDEWQQIVLPAQTEEAGDVGDSIWSKLVESFFLGPKFLRENPSVPIGADTQLGKMTLEELRTERQKILNANSK